MQAIGAILIGAIYLVLLGLVIFLILRARRSRKPHRWLIPVAFELFFALVAFVLAYFFGDVIKQNVIRGETYRAEVVISYVAGGFFIVSLIVTVIIWIISKPPADNSQYPR